MDLKDWHKRLDLEAKLTKRAQDRAAAPPKPFPTHPDPLTPLPGASPLTPPELAAGGRSPELAAGGRSESGRHAPPRKGRGPRREESREELIARLTDPTLTLDETARLLEVCATTVRRWTNKGLLPCERSAGNQRRFKLSSIEAYLSRRDQSPPGEDAGRDEA